MTKQTTIVVIGNLRVKFQLSPFDYLVIFLNEPAHDKTCKTCATSEERSAWASTQSDQSLLH